MTYMILLLAALTDSAFLEADLWNDGQAEVAFYRVERDLDHHGQPNPQRFLMGTYLVKHDFDRARESKAQGESGDAVSAFKWAAFYEFESDESYQYKYNYVLNAAQKDLAPLKASFTSFDWCSNRYRELAFHPDGNVSSLMRSDDYGNDASDFELPRNAYPAAEVPLLVRGLDFSATGTQRFHLLLDDGSTVAVTATLEGRETLLGRSAERIRLSYEGDYGSIVAHRGEREEAYWRASDGDRLLLKIESESYRVTLVEAVRSAYWREDVYTKLKEVSERP